MEQNLMLSLLANEKERRLNESLAEIKSSIQLLMKGQNTMPQMIKVTDAYSGQSIAVNPRYIKQCKAESIEAGAKTIMIIDGEDNPYVIRESLEDVLTKVNGANDKTVIG